VQTVDLIARELVRLPYEYVCHVLNKSNTRRNPLLLLLLLITVRLEREHTEFTRVWIQSEAGYKLGIRTVSTLSCVTHS
jgi:hypothetical protein